MIGTEEQENDMNRGEDASETGSVYEYDDDVYASGEDDVIEATVPSAAPTPAQDNDGPDKEVVKTQRYLCAGVILPYFDLLEAWEDETHPRPGPHYFEASTSRPKKVIERRDRVNGEWRVKHTMCKRCFRMDKAHEKELNAYHTSGLSETAYFFHVEGKRRAKALRKEKNDAAKKRVRTTIEQESTLLTPKAARKEDVFVTPVKTRQPSTVPTHTPGTSSSSSDVVYTSPIVDLTVDTTVASPTYKSATLATLLAGVASANKGGGGGSGSGGGAVSVTTQTETTSPTDTYINATVTPPPVIVDLVPTTTSAGTQTTTTEPANVSAPTTTPITPAPTITTAHTTTPASTNTATAAISATPATPATPAAVVTPAPARTAETITALLVPWLHAVRTHLKVSDLKELCRVNRLMVSGSKAQLLDRLLKCKYHGSPGACPHCRQCKMECEYMSEDLLALPVVLRCKHMRGAGVYCSYLQPNLPRSYFLQAKRRPQPHALPLVDTADGVLQRWGISTGSVLA